MRTLTRRWKQRDETREAGSTDPGGGCASPVGPACLGAGWGRDLHREHRLVPDTTLRDRQGSIKVTTEEQVSGSRTTSILAFRSGFYS